MLLIALGLVVATMRQLNQPGTARRLEQIFSAAEVATQRGPEHEFTLSMNDSLALASVPTESVGRTDPAVPSPISEGYSSEDASSDDASDALAQVQDNTYFRPVENKAWFHLFGRLQQMDNQQLGKQTLGELTYAQLLKQPDVYRGQVVTIRGTLRREDVEQAPENSVDIKTYHRLVIQPRGGGHWPFVVYCLEIPKDLPRGDNLDIPIAVNGFFFKNWSYAWQDGLGIAPVILAREVDWQPASPQKTRRPVTIQALTTAILVAAGFAVAVLWLALRNTRRPRRFARSQESVNLPKKESTNESVHERLQRLAEAETEE